MNYSGGKGQDGVFQKIINQIPPHGIYIEAFLGGGAVLRAKRPAASTIGIDADAAVVEMWRDHELPSFNVICADAIYWLEDRKWIGTELVYLDPPYLFETRRPQLRRRTVHVDCSRIAGKALWRNDADGTGRRQRRRIRRRAIRRWLAGERAIG